MGYNQLSFTAKKWVFGDLLYKLKIQNCFSFCLHIFGILVFKREHVLSFLDLGWHVDCIFLVSVDHFKQRGGEIHGTLGSQNERKSHFFWRSDKEEALSIRMQ